MLVERNLSTATNLFNIFNVPRKLQKSSAFRVFLRMVQEAVAHAEQGRSYHQNVVTDQPHVAGFTTHWSVDLDPSGPVLRGFGSEAATGCLSRDLNRRVA